MKKFIFLSLIILFLGKTQNIYADQNTFIVDNIIVKGQVRDNNYREKYTNIAFRKGFQKLVKNKIPVMGHVGILPQTDKKFTFKGKKLREKRRILNDTKLLENAGVFSIVLECIETNLSKIITSRIKIPTIGIGSSVNCDGQVLVTDDLIGLNETNFRFVKKFGNIKKYIKNAVIKYKNSVKQRKFPSKKNSY